jgi:hypothetical protein
MATIQAITLLRTFGCFRGVIFYFFFRDQIQTSGVSNGQFFEIGMQGVNREVEFLSDHRI